ncbi:MAG: hypothetical protein ACTHJ8_10585 [Mucilaginibacter sp.]
MKKSLLSIALLCAVSLSVSAQSKKKVTQPVQAQVKPDTTIYTFKEPVILQIVNLLAVSEKQFSNSNDVTTSNFNAFHKEVMRIDSIIGVQYVKFHPQTPTKK